VTKLSGIYIRPRADQKNEEDTGDEKVGDCREGHGENRTCIKGMQTQQMSAPAIPINKTHYDHNIDFSCDTADDQQHKEECYVWSAIQVYMPTTPYEK